MKRFVLFIGLIFITLGAYGQDTFVGKIFSQGEPPFSSEFPPVPCTILWFETASGNYILSFDSYWILCGHKLIVEGIEFDVGDEVEITGTVTSLGVDIYSVEHFTLEIETIKLTHERKTFAGKIIQMLNPTCKSTVYPCPPCGGMVAGLETTSGNYVLSPQSGSGCSANYLSIEDVVYLIGDDVEITGVVNVINRPDLPEEYSVLEVETIKLTRERKPFVGKIISMWNPLCSPPAPPSCLPEESNVFGLTVAYGDYDFYEFVLSSDSQFLINKLLIEGAEYFIDDEVKITGTVSEDQDSDSRKYTALEIETIEKLPAQEVFPLSGAKWTEVEVRSDLDGLPYSFKYYSFYFEGDTIIDNIQRSKLYADFDYYGNEDSLLMGFFYVDEKKVYFRINEETLYSSPISLCTEVGVDYLLYDFGLNVNDCIEVCGVATGPKIDEVDSVMLGDQKRKRYIFNESYISRYCIEGMGNTGGLFSLITAGKTCPCYTTLVCFSQNDEVLYLSPNFIDCSTPKPLSAEDASTGNFTISPNPAGEVVTVSHPSEVIREVALYDNAGRQLLVRQSDSGSMQLALPYPSGIYHLTITTASGKRYHQKMVRE